MIFSILFTIFVSYNNPTKRIIAVVFRNKFQSDDFDNVMPRFCLMSIKTLCGKDPFIFAEFLHHGMVKTLAATASMEEGLQLIVQTALFPAPKS